MKRLALRFPSWARLSFSATFLLSLLSGSLWFYLGRWGDVEGEFGPEKHPWILTLTKIHGAAAFTALISIGMILGGHIPAGWRSGWSRKSGIAMLLCIAFMVTSAWGLYSAGSDTVRDALVWVHLCSGGSLPLWIILHIRSAPSRLAR
jgi:hypothetical protein